ncbi:hypothetical protein IFR05_010036 [Cadophora sp. M221]|nr:hypothetical protein IFR05_010036 [Cadophora sp. M221]
MPPLLQCTATLTSVVCTRQLCRVGASSRSFSTSPRHEQRTTRARRGLFRWLQTNGTNFLNPREDSTNYLTAYNNLGQLKRVVVAAADKEREEAKKREEAKDGPGASAENAGASKDSDSDGETKAPKVPPESIRDLRPFPLNVAFTSPPVLGGMLKEEIWFRIMVEGKSVREVSAELGVEMARVGAVVRLKEIEKEWERIIAVSKMLPKTMLSTPGKKQYAHETINDLPVHRATGQQIWHPTSESRRFTRVDAAKVFDDKLLPADARVPHPELTVMQKEFMEDLTFEQQQERAAARDSLAEKKRAVKAARQAKKEAAIKKVDTGRWEFHITDINVDAAGKTGRGHKGVGWRYGQPHDDRTRGKIKIPTSVE